MTARNDDITPSVGQVVSLLADPRMKGRAEKLEADAQARAEANAELALYEGLCQDVLVPRFAVLGSEFWDCSGRVVLSEDELNVHPEVRRVFGFKRNKSEVSPSTLLRREATAIDIAGLVTRSGDLNPIVMGEDAQGSPIRLGNRWLGAGVPPAAAGAAPPAEFVEHVRWMIPNYPEAKWLLDFMAWRYQRAGAYSPLIVLLAGNGRIGKDLCLSLYWRVVGKHNVRQVGMAQLTSAFNGFLTSPFVYVPEFTMSGPKGREMYSNIKEWSGGGAEGAAVLINAKFQPVREEAVQPTFFLTTNSDTALAHMPNEDARLSVVGCNARPVKFGDKFTKGSPAYFARLAALFEDPVYIARVARWLLDQDVSGFDAARAPITTARAELMATSLSPQAQQAYNLVVTGELAGRRLISSLELGVLLQDHGNAYTAAAYAAGLRRAGCESLGRFGSGSSRQTVYSGASVIGTGGAVLAGLSDHDRDSLIDLAGKNKQALLDELKAEQDATGAPFTF